MYTHMYVCMERMYVCIHTYVHINTHIHTHTLTHLKPIFTDITQATDTDTDTHPLHTQHTHTHLRASLSAPPSCPPLLDSCTLPLAAAPAAAANVSICQNMPGYVSVCQQVMNCLTIYTYIYIYTHTYVCIYTHTYTHIYRCTHIP